MFPRADAEDVTEASDAAIKMTLYRLKKSGAIVSPRRDFFVVVPREYRSAGSPPASWFIDDLMRRRGRQYYVALLSAAALHGAGHQLVFLAAQLGDSAITENCPALRAISAWISAWVACGGPKKAGHEKAP